MTGKEKLAHIYRKRLKNAPYTNASKLLSVDTLTDQDIDMIVRRIGYVKARNLLLGLGLDVDWTHGYDDGETIEPRRL